MFQPSCRKPNFSLSEAPILLYLCRAACDGEHLNLLHLSPSRQVHGSRCELVLPDNLCNLVHKLLPKRATWKRMPVHLVLRDDAVIQGAFRVSEHDGLLALRFSSFDNK